jgi:hypothetical protein
MPVLVTFHFGSSPYTANSTVTVSIPSPAGKCFPLRAYVSQKTIAADPDGTVVFKLVKRQASDDADVILTTAHNLEDDTAYEKAALTFVTTLTDAQRIFLAADTLEADLISNSAAITTEPVDLQVVVEFAVLE